MQRPGTCIDIIPNMDALLTSCGCVILLSGALSRFEIKEPDVFVVCVFLIYSLFSREDYMLWKHDK